MWLRFNLLNMCNAAIWAHGRLTLVNPAPGSGTPCAPHQEFMRAPKLSFFMIRHVCLLISLSPFIPCFPAFFARQLCLVWHRIQVDNSGVKLSDWAQWRKCMVRNFDKWKKWDYESVISASVISQCLSLFSNKTVFCIIRGNNILVEKN